MDKKILHSVFEHIASQFPERIAIEEESRSISYKELNSGANKIAHALVKMGIGQGIVVGLSFSASIEYIMSNLAVQKAGAIFMPLDADAPPQRLAYMIKKTEPQIILDLLKIKEILSSDSYFKDSSADNNLYLTQNLGLTLDPQSPHYIIFTSGSTGDPKAILGKQVSMSHFINWEITTFGLDENVKTSLFAPTTFDVSFRDIFVPLLCGGTVCIPEATTIRNIPLLVDWMTKSRLTLVHCVPTLFRLIRKELKARKMADSEYQPLPDLQNILLAGEALYGTDVIDWMDLVGDRIKLTNIYGPSETTLAKIHYRITERPAEANKIMPLGEPITNTAILILKDNRLCKVGEIGEIHIKTPFRSHGYYKDPELTAQWFIQNPLTPDTDIIYKTGDLGRYQPDRKIEFIGRLDSQVKINGIRIELAEIESRLFTHHAIERPLIIAHTNPDHEARLVCYYTLKEPVSDGSDVANSVDSKASVKSDEAVKTSGSGNRVDLDPSQLRTFLAEYLPPYMIPSFFVRLKEFPLNINGKVDRKRLPKPEDLLYDRIPYAPPENEREVKLAAIFSEVLGIDKVGANTPFLDLGGNSLSAIRIISRIFAEFRVEVAIRDFFENPSIRQLAMLLDNLIKKSIEGSSSLKIEPVPLADSYPLSHAQRRLWILEKLDPNFIAYNIPGAYLIKGDLNIANLTEAFQAVIRRHESLRTVFKVIDGEPRQVILDELEFNLFVENISELEAVKAELKKDAATSFDMENGPLMRVRLFKVADAHVISMNIHHIISDALSQEILIKELLTYYEALCLEGLQFKEPLPPLNIHYKDYVAWHNIQEQGSKMQGAREYWKKRLSGDLPPLNLPTDNPRPMMQTAHGDRLTFELDPDIYSRLLDFSRNRQASLFMVLTAMIKVILYRYTGQEDIIVGTPIAARTHTDLENQIGLYINMLALRDKISPSDNFDKFLSKVRDTCSQAFEYQIYPFDRLVGELSLERDLSRNVGFDVMVVFHNQEQELPSVAGLTAEIVEFENPTAKYDLTFTFSADVASSNTSSNSFKGNNIDSDRKTLAVEIEYNTDLFFKERIIRLSNHFSTLASTILSDLNKPISHLEIMTSEEKEKVLFGFNKREVFYPKDKTVTELVEEHAARYPDDPAVAFEEKVLSYQELNNLSNILAHKLIKDFDIKNEQVVPILMEKSHWVIAAMLGILKSGAAYLPVNLSNPPDRIKFILQDAGCKVLLSDKNAISDKLAGLDDICTVIDVPAFFSGFANNQFSPTPAPLPNGEGDNYSLPLGRVGEGQNNIANPKVTRKSSDLGFVIYTSGSTGLPKGTLLEHRQMLRLIYKPDGVILKRGGRMSQTTAFSFDVHVFEIWGGLINGCCVCVPPEAAIVEAPRMKSYIQGHKLQTMWLTTSLFNQFVEADITMLEGVEQLIVGGEKLSTPHINRVKKRFPTMRVFDGYGPTENSVFTTLFEIEKFYTNEIPIGRPSANSKITILDANNQPVPIGIPGELCAWGDGVARGYLNRPDLNEKNFGRHPLFPNERMYRIGDMGSWDSDGIISYYGRNDDQVKVRGYRIELGEISNALMEHPDIQQTIIMVRTLADGFNKELVAYFTSKPEALKILNAQTLRAFLGERLPGYMIPAHFVGLEKMPLNPSGKVDRRNLPAPETMLSSSEDGSDAYTPKTPVEKTLLEVWQKVLGLSKIGIYDNYFNVGGDSIKAIQIVSLLAREDKLIEVRDIFQNPTIADLSRHVRQAKKAIDQAAVTGEVPLTPVQKWFFTHHKTSLHHFNQAQLISSSEPMNPESLKKALAAVQHHHDALRMTYNCPTPSSLPKGEGNITLSPVGRDGVGLIFGDIKGVEHPLDFEFIDLSKSPAPDVALTQQIEAAQSTINLENGPLMKSRLIRMPNGDRLLLILHHLIVDGISWRILSEDINTAYKQIEACESVKLPAKTHSFKTWAEAINQFATNSGTDLMEEINYWKSVESYQISELPFNGQSAAKGQVYQKDTASLNICLDKEHTNNLLGNAHQALRTQTNDLLLTALARALSSWHGQSATRINLEGHGREDILKGVDINRTVGWFTSMYPVVLELPDNNDISYQVKHIKETLRKVPNNGVGYGILRYLTEITSTKAEIEWNTLPSISFNYLGQFDTDIAQGFSIAKESAGKCIGDDVEITQDIDINSIITKDGLEISLTYNTKALTKRAMENLLENFRSELETVIDHLINKAETTLTPSDIDFDGLGIDELDDVLNGIGGDSI
ncbi:MAG: amino acid adenylation domain-containing protein [Desulfamplus sp.]|nr:amino acid adenylation domain-containing protein [Desulfamplus sp.]